MVQWYNSVKAIIVVWSSILTPGTAFKQLFLTKFTTTALMNRWQLEYRNCVQRTGETVGEYVKRFTKVLQRLENTTPFTNEYKDYGFYGRVKP